MNAMTAAGSFSPRDVALIKAAVAGIVPEVRAYFEESVRDILAENKALADRIASLEARGAEKGEQGERGRDGVDGNDGRDGEPGSPGEPGQAGRDGIDGRDGVDGKNGLDGPPGPPGERGADGLNGKDGADGRDGVGLAGALIDRGGNLVLTLTDGTTRDLGQVVGKDGRDGLPGEKGRDGRNGRDGLDGAAWDDLALDYDGERRVNMTFTKGDRVKSFAFQLPVLLDRGVYKEGQTYQAGDAVTWGGSLWIAQKETTAKPDSGDGFRLAVKRGRDGKDAQTTGQAKL